MKKITLLLILPFLFILVLSFLIKTSNKFNRYGIIIEESKRNLDVALAKRYDTICEMIKVCKSYARHEKSIFSEVTMARSGSNIKDLNKTINNQDKTIEKIFALAEDYPELKSSEEFLNLQDQIDDENEQLAAAKRIVNNNISKLNQDIVTFPKSIVASMKGLRKADFLDEENIERKKSLEDFDYEV